MPAHIHDTTLNYDEFTCDQSSNYGVFATSFSNVDGTNLSLQISIGNQASTGQALVGFSGNVAVPVGQKGYFNLLVNGTLNAANDGIIFAGEGTLPVSFTRLVTGLNVGTLNTINLQSKVTGGTMTVYNGAGTSNLDMHPQFWGLVL